MAGNKDEDREAGPSQAGLNQRLFEAASEGAADVVGELLGQGADVNAVNAYGSTPLHLAASGGSAELIAALVAAGADVNAKDRKDRTPLERAEEQGGEAAAQAIREAVSLRHAQRVKAMKVLRGRKG